MSTHGGEGSQDSELRYSPDGPAAQHLGEFSLQLRCRLVSPDRAMPFESGDMPRWSADDRAAFTGLMDFEVFVPPKRDIEESFAHRFVGATRFREALPFSNRERRWLYANHWMFRPSKAPQTAEGVRTQAMIHALPIEFRFIALGICQGVDRRDLVRRWPAWRREADEFAGQGKLYEARSALYDLGRELFPDAE